MPLAGIARSYRMARMRLPQPWAIRLGELVYLPGLARKDPNTLIVFGEERLIEELLASGGPLENVGPGLSERVVEVPWVMRAIADANPARILDVGTAFSPIVYKRALIRLPQQVEVVDLAEVEIPLPRHCADVRELPFADFSFDAVLCISTLEHIGMDNERYSVPSGGEGDVAALREMGRVGRSLLVTVPGGVDESIGWLRQYAPRTFRERAAEAGLQVRRLEVFAHDSELGWHPVAEEAVDECHFGRETYAAAAVICAELYRAE